MKSDTKKLSWSKVFCVNLKALALIYRECPPVVLSRMLYAVWVAITPYANIYLSARIIEELTLERNMQRLAWLVGITLFVSVSMGLVTAFLTKWKNVHAPCGYYHQERIYSRKLFDMDFVSVDDTKVHDLLNKIRQSDTGGGWGFYSLMTSCETLLSAVISFLGGVSLTISLFTRKVPDSAGAYTILNHPLFVVAIIGVMLLITWISPLLSNKANSYYAIHSGNHSFANRLFGHFGFHMLEKRLATDMRMYKQNRLCEKVLTSKTDAFCSQGIFARLAWGPMGFLQAASAAVSVIFTAVVYIFVCMKAWAGAFGVGSVTQYIAAITKASSGVSLLIATAGKMKNNTPFLEPIFDFLDIPNPMYQGSLTVEKRRDRDYEVEFKNVSFKYPGSDSWALRNVNMKFKVGSRMAVVGRNGSGKTTFIKLLCRLYDPTEGEILLNGINIRKYNYLDYLMIFSVVFQDFKLFSLKLGENVASGVEYDRELAEDCLKKAGFGERLEAMPEGLDTFLYKDFNKDGVDVSGGEAQKIALARALYKDAPFIVLDEPTAALDPIAEAEIYSKFNDIVDDKTAIYISHRLSSCKFCDEIAVFKDGAVVQKGSHSTLLADESGEYYELWNAQAQYYTA